MRILFTILPGAGTFHPHVPLALALKRAGHEVAFAVARSYCPTVEAAGFTCFPAGYDWLMSEREHVVAVVRKQLGSARFSPLEDMYAAFLAPRMVPELLVLVDEWAPDVVVRDPMEFAGCIAAEARGVPHAACGPLFAFWAGAWHGRPNEIGKPVFDDVRVAHGLPPDPKLTMLHRYLHLAFLPPSFPDPRLEIPSTVHFLRSPGFNQSEGESLPDWVPPLAKLPVVHASLGTVFHRTPGVYDAIIEGLKDQRINLIVTVGKDQDPARYGVQPPNVRLERYIPHSLLLPLCDAVITHCGFSSVMACLEQGLPMVAMPLAGDQPANAGRCVALGAARLVVPDERTPRSIREAVLEVLGTPVYRTSARRVQCEMESLPGPEHAVGLLEQLASARAPVANTQTRAASAG